MKLFGLQSLKQEGERSQRGKLIIAGNNIEENRRQKGINRKENGKDLRRESYQIARIRCKKMRIEMKIAETKENGN